MDDGPLLIDCKEHQRQRAAVLCQHLVAPSAVGLGFIVNSDDSDDLQAWCSECEAYFLAEGGMTSAFQAFNGMSVVCTRCYEAARKANATSA